MAQYKLNPTERFSDRVDTYIKYRPGYPKELSDFLKNELNLGKNSVAVDVGSGTGIFSEFLLKNGYQVVGVEPNKEMRLAAEQSLKGFSFFKSVDGRSEDTHQPSASADFITAAQAFHWFEPTITRIEFKRILKPGAPVILIWNDRKTNASPFAVEYEALINAFSTDYRKVNHKNIVEDKIKSFLGKEGYGTKIFCNYQELDFEGLLGRLTSSSYAPNINHPKYPEMTKALQKIFDQYHFSGRVKIEYDTKVYYGRF